MRESREFYISDDGIRLHLKLDFPQENCDENSDESCGKSGGESFGEGCLALPSETNRTEKTEKAEEIKKTEKAEKAEKARKKAQATTYQGNYKPVVANSYGIKSTPASVVKKSEVKVSNSKTLFDDVDDLPFETPYGEIPFGQVTLDKTLLKSLVLQLVTGSIIISSNSKIDLHNWAKSMTSLYEKRFGKGKEGMENFEMWADIYVEYLTWYIKDEKLEQLGFDESEICAICAHDMIEELTKLPENDYIKGYIDALQKYLKV
jgi:hypothetical protein